MSKRLHCSLDNSSGLFFKKKEEEEEEEAAYAAFLYLLTCPLHFSHGFKSTAFAGVGQ